MEYKPVLGLRETEKAIKLVKDTFEAALAKNLNLERVSAPLFVTAGSGLNDDLNGRERAVGFDILETGVDAQIVHSLAKWKRLALKRYGFAPGEGLYTDMNAIRRDETTDNLHSLYVDQWDWEKVITRQERNFELLKETVREIVKALAETKEAVHKKYTGLELALNEDVYFLTSQELLLKYPNLNAKQRENKICREYGTVFIMQIGGVLSNGEKHDGRAPDYDDWSLNGDLLVWYEPLGCAVELSSMGIRVDEEALESQLKAAGCESRAELPFHRALLNGELPLTMGGGLGQSRICMVLLGKIHVGEVQVSLWPGKTVKECEEQGINLL